MAEGTPDDFYLVETIVATVHNNKIPKLIEVMENTRARNLDRFDAEALRLEEDVRRTAQQLRVYCQRVALEWSFHIMRGQFNTLWSRLRTNFREFCAHCLYLGISVSHTRCLTLTDDEASASEEGDGPSRFYYTFEGRKRRRELINEESLDLLEFTIYCLCVGEGVTRF